MILDMLVKIALYEQALATITDRGVLFSLFSLAIIMLIISNLWEWWTMGGFLLPLSSLITPQSKYASIWLYLHPYLIWFSVAGKILIFFFLFSFAQIQIRDWRFLLIRKTCGCNKSLFSLFLEFSICMLQLFKAWLLLWINYSPLELWTSTAMQVFIN
jgi:hypothetical protein